MPLSEAERLKYTRAATAAQTLLNAGDPTLVVDGKAGSHTLRVYLQATQTRRALVDSMVSLLGFPGSVNELYEIYAKEKAGGSGSKGLAPRAGVSSQTEITFATQAVPALIRAASAAGIWAPGVVTQACIESGWGRHIPKTQSGESSNNYSGIKYETERQRRSKRGAFMYGVPVESTGLISTTESATLNSKPVAAVDSFACFKTVDEFAQCKVAYLVESSRYPTIRACHDIDSYSRCVAQGGYAGNNQSGYISLMRSVYASAMQKFPALKSVKSFL